MELADFEGGWRWESDYNAFAVRGRYWDVISNWGWERTDHVKACRELPQIV